MRRTHALTGVMVTVVLLGGGSAFGTTPHGSDAPPPDATTTLTTTASSDPTPSTTPSPTASPSLASATTVTTSTVSAGTTVRHTLANAQRLLNSLGCDAGVADGRAGTHTAAAIIRFQSANRLSQTGSLSSTVWSKLTATRKVACNRRPVPANTSSGRRMVVSRTQNWVWLVNSDGSVRWQGGMIDNPTVWRSGTYRSGSDCGRPAHSRTGLDYSKTLRLDYFTRLVTGQCGVGFHRVPIYRTSGNQIHPDWYLGTNLKASHGCMRVSLRTAQEITAFTAGSTKVVVTP
jgi:peptidoglycan hydrolase-like protein with peptidoglycan-binding domain